VPLVVGVRPARPVQARIESRHGRQPGSSRWRGQVVRLGTKGAPTVCSVTPGFVTV
jgi:hypothetical protein